MESDHISLYLMSGLATAPHFLDGFRSALQGMLEKRGHHVHSELLFPYGDWSRRVLPQLREIGLDMRLGVSRYTRSIGGKRALEAIDARSFKDGSTGRTILVGHSGGGVAAVHAARLLLERDGGEPCLVILIGVPKFRIPLELRNSVLYLYAVGDRLPAGKQGPAKLADAICRLGSFGGWARDGRMLPAWRMNHYAPEATCGVPIIGGHPDYFREQPPYINSHGLSNGWLTLHAVWSWLEERI
ncbi:hypothetical protein Back11_42720 [Paenibacillus baekrokdamisoli]|uniref:Uncharacterized protein n=1 Tax=Paenibacillus baekrokdamisoli TaxID=1712516 RepID=A0A3G9IVP2_9BACL|nr:hypothetical protein [Paenibacillus baekrokdamisoli]MBB3068025.1 pimeloyl-ACP methyl ester carboxylesterase [Paenibacillus baekrokdamisoli]BBH22927.1 hypothetical protein Back11_42720 [Paenibacillus baekrokdamisoli]